MEIYIEELNSGGLLISCMYKGYRVKRKYFLTTKKEAKKAFKTYLKEL